MSSLASTSSGGHAAETPPFEGSLALALPKQVSEAERRRTDFWLTDPFPLSKWLPHVKFTLVHLCIADYGHQAIMQSSKIVMLLSGSCRLLETLDLRNLFIDTSECEIMPSMVGLTSRCVKLSTPATEVEMECPELEKLQLKMNCPQKLIINARNLNYEAFNMDVNMDVLEDSRVEMFSMVGLRELLYGATSFTTLTSLVEKNIKNLEKVFLDIPCMALAEDGRFLGVLKDTSLLLPSFTKLHEWEKLDVLNIGPGLWHTMETQVGALQRETRWPSMNNTTCLASSRRSNQHAWHFQARQSQACAYTSRRRDSFRSCRSNCTRSR